MTAKLVTAKEMAVRYSAHLQTIYKWTYCGILPVVKINKRCIRYDVEKCDLALERRTRKISLCAVILLQFALANSATKEQQTGSTIDGTSFVMSGSPVQIREAAPLFTEVKALGLRLLAWVRFLAAFKPFYAGVCS